MLCKQDQVTPPSVANISRLRKKGVQGGVERA